MQFVKIIKGNWFSSDSLRYLLDTNKDLERLVD